MTKFLVLTQNTIVPSFLEGNGHADMSTRTEKERIRQADKKTLRELWYEKQAIFYGNTQYKSKNNME
jgi:hypothetical protein